MAFLDNFGQKISQTGQDAVRKAKNLADVTKLNNQIADEQQALNTLYQKIGRAYYEAHGQEPDDVFADSLTQISQGLARIEQLREEVQQLKNVVVCDRCGEENEQGTNFCSACGARLAPPDAPETKRCPGCGQAVEPSALFCTACGSKL